MDHTNGQGELTTASGFRVDDALAGLKPSPLAFHRNGELVEYDGTTETKGGVTLYGLRVVGDSPRIGERLLTMQAPEGQARAGEHEAKQEVKRERLESAADRAEAEADRRYQAARGAVAGIPFGQPILVGHHSEGRHRAALRRHDTNMRKASEATDTARDLARRAASIGEGGISSDDPAAVAKLEDKRTALERERDAMKAANAYYRKAKTLDGWDGPADIAQAGRSNLLVWGSVYSSPFPPYALSNIGARIRQAATRTAQVARNQAIAATSDGPTAETLNGCTITADWSDNRVSVTFPARLSKADYQRVRGFGFVWARTRGAFVRKLTGPGVIEYARQMVRAITEGSG